MNMSKAFVSSCNEVMSMFNLTPKLTSESVDKTLCSAQEVNVLLGLANGVNGNILICLSKETALKIVSSMMGGMQVTEFDEMTKSALGEFTNMLSGTCLRYLDSGTTIDLSPPSIAIGDNMFIMISRVPSQRLEISIDSESSINISYCIE